MIHKVLAGMAASVLLLPVAAIADEAKEHGTFEMWKHEVGDSKSYAVADSASGKAAVAEIENGEVVISTGEVADEAIKDIETRIQSSLPPEHADGLLQRMEIDADRDTKKVVIIKKEGDEDVDVEKLLKEHGIELSGDGEKKIVIRKEVTKDVTGSADKDVEVLLNEEDIDVLSAGEGKKKVVIRKEKTVSDNAVEVELDENVTVDIDIDTEEDSVVKKRVKVMTMPEPPVPPQPGKEGTVTKQSSKYEYRLSDEQDGQKIEKRFMRIKGAEADQAEEFIDDLNGLSKSDKRKMKEALGL